VKPTSPLVFAHRGGADALPEHTLAAYLRALDEGADGVECDVRLTRDGHLVCVHDRRLNRTSNGRGLVSTKTLAELDALVAHLDTHISEVEIAHGKEPASLLLCSFGCGGGGYGSNSFEDRDETNGYSSGSSGRGSSGYGSQGKGNKAKKRTGEENKRTEKGEGSRRCDGRASPFWQKKQVSFSSSDISRN